MRNTLSIGFLALTAGFTTGGEQLDLDFAKISADKIERIQQNGKTVIQATGDAYLFLREGHFSGYSFASIVTPIVLCLENRSVSCSGWFVATNGEETFHFGVDLAKEPSIVFHPNGTRSGRGHGVILIPGISSSDEKIADNKKQILEALALISEHSHRAEQDEVLKP